MEHYLRVTRGQRSSLEDNADNVWRVYGRTRVSYEDVMYFGLVYHGPHHAINVTSLCNRYFDGHPICPWRPL